MGLRQRSITDRTHRYWHAVFITGAVLLALVGIRRLSGVLTPLAAALLLSYLLDPVVCWLERRLRLPRWAGALALFAVALILVAATVLLVIPRMIRELRSFAEAIPAYVQNVRDVLVPWVERTFSVEVPTTFHELTEQVGADAKQMAGQVLKPLGGVAGKVAKGTAGLLSAFGTLLLVPIFTFYFLPKFPEIVAGIGELIPRRYYGWVRDTLREIDTVLSAWIRGQLTVVAILAVLYSVGLSIVGIKMAVLIGTLTGLLAFIPYVGLTVGLVLSVLVCLLEYTGPGQLIGIAVVFGVVQAAEGLLLTPYLVGEKVGLGAVGVLVALMIAGELFGFVGILLAVPAAAAVAVIIRRLLARYRESRFYRRDAPLQAGGGGRQEPREAGAALAE